MRLGNTPREVEAEPQPRRSGALGETVEEGGQAGGRILMLPRFDGHL